MAHETYLENLKLHWTFY